MDKRNPILGKYILTGLMECKTGLHIGAQGSATEIGSLDNPVIRDPITREPYIPGSSLRGKLRSLHERRLDLEFDAPGGSGTLRHECDDPRCASCRLFGAATGKNLGGGERKRNRPGRLIVRDARLTAESRSQLERIDTGLMYTEWKVENALDRVTCAANPRQMERIPAGSVFHFSLVYTANEEADVEEDLTNLGIALALLEDDYLGGSGSRGYGQVAFRDLKWVHRPLGYYLGREPERVLPDVPGYRAAAHATA